MDDNAKQASSYKLDQDILDARGVNMTVEEVAGLSTSKYSERVQSLRLNADDLAFLKGLRRRIKNRLASQNSRRRGVEHLRRLTRELRVVRVRRENIISERKDLLERRETTRDQCRRLRDFIAEELQERSDNTELPSIEVASIPKWRLTIPKLKFDERISPSPSTSESQSDCSETPLKKVTVTETRMPESYLDHRKNDAIDLNLERVKFECRIDKLVQQSVNHMFKENTSNANPKKVLAKTVFISNDDSTCDVKSLVIDQPHSNGLVKHVDSSDSSGVLNLSVKEVGRRKGHGRKQPAPRRLYLRSEDYDEDVLDLKIKKEGQ